MVKGEDAMMVESKGEKIKKGKDKKKGDGTSKITNFQEYP